MIINKKSVALIMITAFLSIFAVNTDANANNCITALLGKIYKPSNLDKSLGETYMQRGDFNCNGVPDTIIGYPDKKTGLPPIIINVDRNENRQLDMRITPGNKVLIIEFDNDEDGHYELIGYDYNFDFKVDKWL